MPLAKCRPHAEASKLWVTVLGEEWEGHPQLYPIERSPQLAALRAPQSRLRDDLRRSVGQLRRIERPPQRACNQPRLAVRQKLESPSLPRFQAAVCVCAIRWQLARAYSIAIHPRYHIPFLSAAVGIVDVPNSQRVIFRFSVSLHLVRKTLQSLGAAMES